MLAVAVALQDLALLHVLKVARAVIDRFGEGPRFLIGVPNREAASFSINGR
jgi:hypothetical protein